MIAYLHGQLAEATPTHVIVDCHGVGYAVFIPLSSYDKLPMKGNEVKLLTYHHVVTQDGTQQLFGFVTPEEQKLSDAILALVSLGYKQVDAHRIVLAAADKSGPKASVEDLVRTALRTQ
jgi:Holliday junction resolvasome RuvABC DNA-binding subunit